MGDVASVNANSLSAFSVLEVNFFAVPKSVSTEGVGVASLVDNASLVLSSSPLIRCDGDGKRQWLLSFDSAVFIRSVNASSEVAVMSAVLSLGAAVTGETVSVADSIGCSSCEDSTESPNSLVSPETSKSLDCISPADSQFVNRVVVSVSSMAFWLYLFSFSVFEVRPSVIKQGSEVSVQVIDEGTKVGAILETLYSFNNVCRVGALSPGSEIVVFEKGSDVPVEVSAEKNSPLVVDRVSWVSVEIPALLVDVVSPVRSTVGFNSEVVGAPTPNVVAATSVAGGIFGSESGGRLD